MGIVLQSEVSEFVPAWCLGASQIKQLLVSRFSGNQFWGCSTYPSCWEIHLI